MKKLLSVILCLLMCTSVLISCSDTEVISEGNEAVDSGETSEKKQGDDAGKEASEVSYVMIYNPEIYNPNAFINSTKTTGKLATQVVAASHRAESLTEPPAYIPNAFDASDFIKAAEGKEFEMDRAVMQYAPYSAGDNHAFFTFDENDNRVSKDFICKYAGQYCNIWLEADVYASDEVLEDLGEFFDQEVYEQTTDLFGDARFADNGRKVNLLVSDLTDGTGGFFTGLDSITMSEATVLGCADSGINDGHAIVNINVDYVNNPAERNFVYTTMAHELQHAICFNDFVETGFCYMPNTWLNEAMSGYVEDYLVEGTQYEAGRYDSWNESKRIRHGQSLYNFDTTTTFTEWDIGVYGSVYVFSEYIADLAGDEYCFKKLHNKYITSYGVYPVSDSDALYSIIPRSEKERIDGVVEYPSSVAFATDESEFMSKLALDFYISGLTYDEGADPDAFKYVDAAKFLYDEINPATIEGGGRIIVELKNGEFAIPEDADDGLVYVSLDKNFEVVDIIVK